VAVRPDVFAVVMATGVVAISADDQHQHLISVTLAALGGAAMATLVAVVVGALSVGRGFAFRQLDEPDPALRLFSFVAGCAVLAVWCEPQRLSFWVLGAVAVIAWLALTPIAVHAIATHDLRQLRDSARGAWLLWSVGTSSVGIVVADTLRESGHRALLPACLALWALAVAIYALITSLIVWRAVADRSTVGRAEADSWILMGGLAIATLAGNHIYRALDVSSPLRAGVAIATIVMWALATAWIPLLIYFSLRRVIPRARSLRFAWAWWAMVFPLGMYSVATFATYVDSRLAGLSTISLVFFWIALAVWLVVAVMGAIRAMAVNRPRAR
jgi:tellurite resistance protein TehA-like permease